MVGGGEIKIGKQYCAKTNFKVSLTKTLPKQRNLQFLCVLCSNSLPKWCIHLLAISNKNMWKRLHVRFLPVVIWSFNSALVLIGWPNLEAVFIGEYDDLDLTLHYLAMCKFSWLTLAHLRNCLALDSLEVLLYCYFLPRNLLWIRASSSWNRL